MKLFEVTSWGHNGDANDADTNYLVSANNYLEAAKFVEKIYKKLPDMVMEIGTTTTEKLAILRGPYIAFAVNNGGWKRWMRKIDDHNKSTSEYEER